MDVIVLFFIVKLVIGREGRRIMKKLVALMVLVAMVSAGCTGSFMLTKKVYNFHRGQEGKWMDELFFLGTVVLPVYGLATLGDAIIFNSIEFWTDENPIEAKAQSDESIVLEQGDAQAVLTYARSDGSLHINADDTSLTLERNRHGVAVRDETGRIVYTAMTHDDGTITVYNGKHQLVKKVSPEQVTVAKRQLFK